MSHILKHLLLVGALAGAAQLAAMETAVANADFGKQHGLYTDADNRKAIQFWAKAAEERVQKSTRRSLMINFGTAGLCFGSTIRYALQQGEEWPLWAGLFAGFWCGALAAKLHDLYYVPAQDGVPAGKLLAIRNRLREDKAVADAWDTWEKQEKNVEPNSELRAYGALTRAYCRLTKYAAPEKDTGARFNPSSQPQLSVTSADLQEFIRAQKANNAENFSKSIAPLYIGTIAQRDQEIFGKMQHLATTKGEDSMQKLMQDAYQCVGKKK